MIKRSNKRALTGCLSHLPSRKLELFSLHNSSIIFTSLLPNKRSTEKSGLSILLLNSAEAVVFSDALF